MAYRGKYRKDKRVFRNTAVKTNRKNLLSGNTPRGGTRL